MTARARAARLARLERLEAAVAALPDPSADRPGPAAAAAMFGLVRGMCAGPGVLLPSARGLYAAFSAFCSALPQGRDIDLAESRIAAFIPALRRELVTFLREHLGTERERWDRSTAWMHLSQIGIAHPYLGARERGPTAEQWCAGLSRLEVVFEAETCLVQAFVRVNDWRHLRNSDHELVRESAALPPEEEAVLLAEIRE